MSKIWHKADIKVLSNVVIQQRQKEGCKVTPSYAVLPKDTI